MKSILRLKLREIINFDERITKNTKVLNVVDAVENVYGVRLPEDYREFLVDYAPCYMNEDLKYKPFSTTPLIDENGYDAVGVMYGAAEEPYNILDVVDSYMDDLGSNVLGIADGNPGDVIVLGLVPSNRGKIYYWHHDDGCLYMIAESFEDFILSMEEAPVDTTFNVDNVRMRLDPDLFDN